jgi:hypothetical protein
MLPLDAFTSQPFTYLITSFFVPDYRVYLRHYTEGWSEAVIYFIPVAR